MSWSLPTRLGLILAVGGIFIGIVWGGLNFETTDIHATQQQNISNSPNSINTAGPVESIHVGDTYESTTSLHAIIDQLKESNAALANQITLIAVMVANMQIPQTKINAKCDPENKLNRLPNSVFSVSTSSNAIGLSVLDQGYVGLMVPSYDSGINVVITKDKGSYKSAVICNFDSKWLQSVSVLKTGEEINFCGEISNLDDVTKLYGCELR